MFSFKGRLVARWSKRLEKITGNVFLRLLLFCELKPCVTKHPKNSITFFKQGWIFTARHVWIHLRGHAPTSNWHGSLVVFFFSACLDDDSSGFVLFLVCFVSSESSATIHASRISGFLVFTAVPLSLCHVKATLYTVNRWSQACLQNWKPPVSPNFGATYPGPILAAESAVCFTKVFQFAMALPWLGCPVEQSSSASVTSTAKATVLGMKMASNL